MNYGYVRVSTKEQNVDRQISALRKEGIESKNIYIDKASGKNFNRDNYKKLVEILKEGDTLFVKSIDRLGRNYDDIIRQWNFLNKEKGVEIVVLDFPLLDTRSKTNGLTGKFLSDIVLQILSYVAQIERENIHQRQREGIIEAKKRGVKFGRPIIEKPDNFEKIYHMYKNKGISLRKGANLLGVSHVTFLNWIRETR